MTGFHTMKAEIPVPMTIEFVHTLDGVSLDTRPTTAAELAKEKLKDTVANHLTEEYHRDGMNKATHKDGLLWKKEEAMFRPALYNLAMAYMNSEKTDMAFRLLKDLSENGYKPALELTGGLNILPTSLTAQTAKDDTKKKSFTIEEMRAIMVMSTGERPYIDKDGKYSWTMEIKSCLDECFFRAIKIVVVLYMKYGQPLLEIHERLNKGDSYVLVKANTISRLMEFKYEYYPLTEAEYKDIKALCQD